MRTENWLTGVVSPDLATNGETDGNQWQVKLIREQIQMTKV